MKRIIFMGTPEFAAYILEQLLAVQQDLYEIVAVVSQPDKAIGRKRVITPTPVKTVAQKHDLPVLQPVKIRDAYDDLASLQPDLIITAAYGQIVPRNILDLPLDKCINVHGSLLPKYRGGAPIHHAIMNGDTETGITIMYMGEKMDAGPMLVQKAIPILTEDTLATMFVKMQELGASLLLSMLPDFFAGALTPVAQNEADVTYAFTIKKEDCKIDWHKSATEIANQVRGLSPAPAAFTQLDGQQVKVYAVSVVDETTNAAPGTLINVTKKSCHVATGDGIIALEDLQLSGKTRQLITAFMGGSGRNLFLEGGQFEN